jgi:hypothetical protein
MSSFKRLNKADVTTVDYSANKRWSFSYTSSASNNYAVGYIGKNEPFSITSSKTTNDQYQSLIYSEINHMFYQDYTNLLNTSSLMFNVTTYESASQYRPTGSYFNYNTNPLLIKQFPVSASNTIRVLSINQDIYGSKILPNSFKITSSIGLITDDGNGNLYTGSEHIGNIFYAHGISVITNQNSKYQSLFPPSTCTSYDLQGGSTGTTFYYTACGGTPTTSSVSIGGEITVCIDDSYSITIASGNGSYLDLDPCFSSTIISFQNEHIIYENEVRCIVKESDYNLSYNPSLVTGSYADGILRGFATGSFFQPYVTTIGLYNDDNELLMVAKLGKPIALSPDTDMTFIVKYDT